VRGVAAGAVAALSGVAAVAASPAGPTSTPNDPGFVRHQQWGLAQAGFPTAWCRSTGAGTLIVVLDTGVDAAHPDLAGKLVGQARVQNGVLTTGTGSAADDSGHGTHVAGIAVADTGNGMGVAGAAPDARLYAIKVLFAPAAGQPEQGSPSDLAQAIDYTADTVAASWPGPVVLNVSIGSADDTSTADTTVSDSNGDISTALEHAYSRGLAIAVAAANAGTSPVGSTAVQDGQALSVGALDENGSVAPYSPTAGVSVFAAGGAANSTHGYLGTGILSTWPHSSAGDYAWMAGTSMAAPHVAAALALLMSTGMSNSQAYTRLLQTEDGQHRLHADAALGSTTPCGAHPQAVPVRPAAAAPAAVVANSVPGPARASASAAPATQPPSKPVAVSQVALPVTGGSPRPTAAHGGSMLGRLALAMSACVVVWMVLPRRLLLRLMRG
jgi:serine protease